MHCSLAILGCRTTRRPLALRLSKMSLKLQDKVAAWHIADIDKAIDALGDAAKGYERDGLRSVAHLGGKSGMAKYVKSKGSYNPADELGTNLQDYYDKFSA